MIFCSSINSKSKTALMRFKILQRAVHNKLYSFRQSEKNILENNIKRSITIRPASNLWFVLKRPDLSIPGQEHTFSGVNAGK